MEVIDKTIYFNNDDEFFDYCVIPSLVPIEYNINGTQGYYYTFNFTPQYNKAINDGITFIIKDDNSQIYKHGKVSYKTITKDVQNLEEWNKYLYEANS